MAPAGLQSRLMRGAKLRASVGYVATALVSPALAQPAVDFAAAQIEILPVQGNVYMLVGPVGNSVVQVGEDGVLIVDTQFARSCPTRWSPRSARCPTNRSTTS